MIRHFLFLLILLITIPLSGQECKVDFRIIKEDFKVSFEEVTPEEFNRANKISKKNQKLDSITELELLQKYPRIFSKIDSCLFFKHNKEEKKVCIRTVQNKSYSDYKILGVFSEKALIKVSGYENWRYWLIDLENELSFSSGGFPLMVKANEFIGYTNYYGEEEITLAEVDTAKRIIITIENWSTVECRNLGNTYYFKLREMTAEGCDFGQLKYMRLTKI